MEIWIPVNVQTEDVKNELQQWLDDYSYHAYRSIVQDRINSRYPNFTIPKALYILELKNRKVITIEAHSNEDMEKIFCSICHEEDFNIKQTLLCNHTFHQHCIERWFRVNNTCPLCRTIS